MKRPVKTKSIADQFRALKVDGDPVQYPATKYQYLWNLARRLGIRIQTQRATTKDGKSTDTLWVWRIA